MTMRRHLKNRALWLAAACAVLPTWTASPALAQAPIEKKIVRTADDLPRYTYRVDGNAAALLTSDEATFNRFANKVGADIDQTLAGYQIVDHATLRNLLTVRLQVEMLTGQPSAALQTVGAIRALEDKPDAKALSGLSTEAMISANADAKAWSGAAYEQAYAHYYAKALAPIPWALGGNRIKEGKSSAQIISENLLIGVAKAQLDPALAKSHELGNELAWQLVGLRFARQFLLPVKAATYAVLAKEVADKNVTKPDIWAARDVSFTAKDKLTPVRVAIWDTGVDLALYPGRVYTDPHPAPQFDPHGLAFDLHSNRAHGNLLPLTPAQQAEYPDIRQDLKGLSDLQLSIDSPEADAFKKKLAARQPAEVAAYLETLGLFGNYVHGTHVAGITARGNPAIRLAAARITFDWKNVPDKPTEELVRKSAASYQVYVDWFKAHGIRVVNMSWGGSPSGEEDALEKNGVGKDAAERKALARHLFDIDSKGLLAALKSAPDILFVCAAGNADSDSSFEETMPAAFKLPNLLVVGAVDQAGDEASFTSYGDTVLVDANGYQVSSYFPGGAEVRLSGTSMASPNTANLAAKLIAIDPKLTPAQTIHLIVAGATPSPDGRRHNINPKKSVELLRANHAV